MITSERWSCYQATGITVVYDAEYDAWSASLEFSDAGWVGDDDADLGRISTSGRLATRYSIGDGYYTAGLDAAIAALRLDAQILGIAFVGTPPDGKPCLYYHGDGEHPDYPPPADWRERLAAAAARIRWRGPHIATSEAGP
jgi:hypothetical protein